MFTIHIQLGQAPILSQEEPPAEQEPPPLATVERARSMPTLDTNARGLIQYLRLLRQTHRHNHWAETAAEPIPYIGPADLLLKEGRFFRPAPLPQDIERGEMKACFANAARLARKRGYTYVEGYATSVIPTEHAWCIDNDGNVVDNTWTGHLAGRAYFGIAFKLTYVHTVQLRTRQYSLLWQDDHPLCTGKDSIDKVVPKEWRRKF